MLHRAVVNAIQVGFKFLKERFENAPFKRRTKAGKLYEFKKGMAAACFAEAEVVFPGGLEIGTAAAPELEGANLGKTIIYIIKRASVNVALALPIASALQIVESVVIYPGAVFLFHFEPKLAAFGGSEAGVFVDVMLKFIHCSAVWQEKDVRAEVDVFIFFSVGTEKEVHPGIGDLLHTHGMYFAGFVGGEVVFFHFEVAAFIALKSVAGFVGKNIHIADSAVEVGKNKGGFIFIEHGAVATGSFSFFVEQIHQPVVHHEAEKFVGFG